MKIVSVNRGASEQVGTSNSGIHKRPAAGPVAVHTLGIDGDVVADQRHHGGPDQAVYVYRAEDYAWWSERLGRELAPGQFGDNLTLSGLPGPDLAIGSRIRIGDVELEVTAARIPCGTLAAHMGETGFVKQFVEAERPGAYCRVIAEGSVTQGQEFTFDAGTADATIVELFRSHYNAPAPDDIRRLLRAPVATRMRARLEEQLG